MHKKEFATSKSIIQHVQQTEDNRFEMPWPVDATSKTMRWKEIRLTQDSLVQVMAWRKGKDNPRLRWETANGGFLGSVPIDQIRTLREYP